MRELAGSMGDFGTLLPLAIGYIVVCDLNPAGLLIMLGIANIATGIVYRIPIPIQPMKVIAVIAIAQQWTPSMIYASGFAMGIIWLFLGVTGVIGRIADITPVSVIRGIQIALGTLLSVEAFSMLSTWWALGAVSLVIVVLLRQNRYAPAAIILVILGTCIIALKRNLGIIGAPEICVPEFTGFHPADMWRSMVLAGFAQIPLTATNAVIATALLIKTYWPDRQVSEKQLSFNMGIMNLILPLFGGMPMCHGAGGLAGQYYFGARSGGANIMEGAIEILLGLFLCSSIAALFAAFPTAIIGAMMFLVGIELIKFAKDVRLKKDAAPLGATVVVSVASNMAYGFLAGLAVHYLVKRLNHNNTSHIPE